MVRATDAVMQPDALRTRSTTSAGAMAKRAMDPWASQVLSSTLP